MKVYIGDIMKDKTISITDNKNVAKLYGVLAEVKMDREGQYTIKFEFPHSEKDNIKILEDFTEKSIILFVAVDSDKNKIEMES